jgi:hypothetical protein
MDISSESEACMRSPDDFACNYYILIFSFIIGGYGVASDDKREKVQNHVLSLLFFF